MSIFVSAACCCVHGTCLQVVDERDTLQYWSTIDLFVAGGGARLGGRLDGGDPFSLIPAFGAHRDIPLFRSVFDLVFIICICFNFSMSVFCLYTSVHARHRRVTRAEA